LLPRVNADITDLALMTLTGTGQVTRP
jgi:hypothetical protein